MSYPLRQNVTLRYHNNLHQNNQGYIYSNKGCLAHTLLLHPDNTDYTILYNSQASIFIPDYASAGNATVSTYASVLLPQPIRYPQNLVLGSFIKMLLSDAGPP